MHVQLYQHTPHEKQFLIKTLLSTFLFFKPILHKKQLSEMFTNTIKDTYIFPTAHSSLVEFSDVDLGVEGEVAATQILDIVTLYILETKKQIMC